MKSKLIKPKERVRDHGEVYTPAHIVRNMCDLIPSEIWEDINTKFLEPCCGNGNILAEIAKRKFEHCRSADEGLDALRSIYGIDILADNVEESRQRLFDMFVNAFPDAVILDIMAAEAILENNIICGDSLKIMRQWAEEEENKCGK